MPQDVGTRLLFSRPASSWGGTPSFPLDYSWMLSCASRQVFGSDVFAHAKQIARFSPGTNVSFAILLKRNRRPQAFDIEEIQLGVQASRPNGTKGKGVLVPVPVTSWQVFSRCLEPQLQSKCFPFAQEMVFSWALLRHKVCLPSLLVQSFDWVKQSWTFVPIGY